MTFKKNDTLSKQKGTTGENIVFDLLKARFEPNNVHDERAEYNGSLYDFWYLASNQIHYVDAKARCIEPDACGHRISFKFWETRELRKYEKFKAETGCPFELWVVDAFSGSVYVGEISKLRKPFQVGDTVFPYSVTNKDGAIETFISPKQFDTIILLSENNRHLCKLRELYNIKAGVRHD